jgi:hypothetical protein
MFKPEQAPNVAKWRQNWTQKLFRDVLRACLRKILVYFLQHYKKNSGFSRLKNTLS